MHFRVWPRPREKQRNAWSGVTGGVVTQRFVRTVRDWAAIIVVTAAVIVFVLGAYLWIAWAFRHL